MAVLTYQLVASALVQAADDSLVGAAKEAMQKAGNYYASEVATHGGYVYFYSLDLKQRWGEGVATADQVWVQPPGTPTVGLAFLKAYEATGNEVFLKAGSDAARALAYGQLKSGGWTNCVDFNPRGERTGAYRNGKGRGKNNSSLDDGQTSSAIRLMVNADRANRFNDREIHESAEVAVAALLNAQFPNGGFPQVWTEPVPPQPVKRANFPDYDWQTEGRVKDYWNMYTLNDNVCGYTVRTLIDAYDVYRTPELKRALRKLGDFLVLAQLPQPQPAWAQQYNYDMQPIWARKFEPPAVAGDESQEVIDTLMTIAVTTGDDTYLKPIPSALAYLKTSLLPDGRLARYYEMKTNRPLYMQRQGKAYSLTYSDANLPSHYGWKWESRIPELEKRYRSLRRNLALQPEPKVTPAVVRKIIASLDDKGRWVSTHDGRALVGQAKMPVGARYLSSEVFANNMTVLASFVAESE